MGVKYLWELLENQTVPNAVVEVDLLKVAREFVKNMSSQQTSKKMDTAPIKFCLVVDGECCLNRLYGGFFSDWICGGQWNRMADFLDKLITLAETANIELTVFFNGAIESQRMNEWMAQQKREYEKVNRVLNHVAKFGYPPGNKLWIAPVGLRMALRMMLRHKNVNVVSTIDDYRQEVIAYCRENNFHGIITDDAEYIAFDPPRLFSASKFKLKFKGTLESRELIVSQLMKELQLTNEKLCFLAALLGNYLLTEEDLRDVYNKADIDLSTENTAEFVVKKLAQYLDNINVSNDLDEIMIQIFGSDNDARAATLKQSIQYYMDGTKDGFLKYRSVSSGKRVDNVSAKGANSSDKAAAGIEDSDISQEPDLDTSKLASENASSEKNLLSNYKEAQSCFNAGSRQEDSVASMSTESCCDISGNSSSDIDNCDTSSCSEPSTTVFDLSVNAAAASLKVKKDKPAPVLPPVPHEVMRTVSERHSKGLMSPYIYQILSQGEIKLPVILEDGRQIPNVYSFYKPIRQMVYAIVFNLHHHMYMASKNNTAVQVDIRIKEWIFNPTAQTHKAEYVKAEPVGWRVPTIQRLWFGTTQDDKRRRLRAFLTCMRSDVQLLLNPEFVPQQLLVAAVVLRYIMSFPEKKVLRKPELDAFIVAALSPEFSAPTFIQDLKIPQLSGRAIQLAALFMKGVEMAMLVNDACGAPVPWLMCCPWLFFDGKLFHYMFVKATSVKNLHELCDNRVGLVMRAERMRQAVLEGLNVQFARPPLPSTLIPSEELKSASYSHQHQHQHHHHHSHSPPHIRPSSYMSQHRMRISAASTTPSSSSLSSASGMAASDVAAGSNTGRARRSLGGRLEIAGVVVGSWGANYSLSQPPYESAAAASHNATAYLLPGATQQPLLPSSLRSHPHQVAGAVGNYNQFGASYRPRSGVIPQLKGKQYKTAPSFIKKKPVKKERKTPGKGRGLGGISVSDDFIANCSSAGRGGGSACNSYVSGSENITTVATAATSTTATSSSSATSMVAVRIDKITESELPNGGVLDRTAGNCELVDDGCHGDCDLNEERFEDAILNGATGIGGGGADVKVARSVHESATTNSLVQPVSK